MNKSVLDKQYGSIIISLAAFIIIGTVFGLIETQKRPSYDYFTAKKSDIVQSITTTGVIKSDQNISLSFKKGGTIASIKVKSGDKISKGKILVSLDNKDTLTAVSQATAALDAANANYEKIKNGATEDNISVTQATVNTAQISLDNIRSISEKNIKSKYDYALNSLNDSYIKMYNAYATVDTIKESHFKDANDQESLTVRNNEEYQIKRPKDEAKSYIDIAKANKKTEDIDSAISATLSSLDKILTGLTAIRNVCDETTYQGKVTATEKSSLDTQKSYISTTQTTISSLQSDISTLKIQTDNNIKTAEATLSQAQASLKALQSPARPEDINIAKANVEAAEANLQVANNAYSDSMIIAPIEGIITNVNPKTGEVVGAGTPIVSMISVNKFQLETYLSQTELGKIKIGDTVNVTIDAYGQNNIFVASIINIDPAATINNGISSYKTTIQFNVDDERIKSGLSANATIIDQKKENAIIVPNGTIYKENNKSYVLVEKNNKIEKMEITIGIEGANGLNEIISGINEGDKVILSGK
jgi:RND family efflux transporter MFP subunit